MKKSFEDHAKYILERIMHRRNWKTTDLEELISYLMDNFTEATGGNSVLEVDKNPVGRPEIPVDHGAVFKFATEEIARDPDFSETKLNKKVATEFGISATKARPDVKLAVHVPKLMRENSIASLVRRRDGK